jgi:hypothetical protein
MLWKNKLRLPQEWLQYWKDKLQYSPDALYLGRRLFHRVFIPDEMMTANREHHRIGGNFAKIKLGCVTYEKFSYFQGVENEKIQGIPLREEIKGVPFVSIRGELYAVRVEGIIELDKYKQNGVLFNRERVILRIPHHKQDKKTWDKENKVWVQGTSEFLEHKLLAWMYIGDLNYWKNHLNKSIRVKSNDSVSLIGESTVFSPIKTFIPRNPSLEEYYYFTPLEYDTLKFKLTTGTSPVSRLWKYRRSS